MNESDHKPVLLNEVLEFLAVRERERYIDATVGRGGHAIEIIRRGGVLLGIDRDAETINHLKREWRQQENIVNWQLVTGNFSDIKQIATKTGFTDVHGVLFDLGLSSWQLEQSGRGFSYQRDEPLDMRMSLDASFTAADLLNNSTRQELYEIFTRFGEEQHSRRLAKAVFRARPLKSTGELRELLSGETPGRQQDKLRTVARVFQAVRIAVNREISNLKLALPQALELLKTGGRLLVISFHSLEDRTVKQIYLAAEKENRGKIITKKPLRPTPEEVKRNRRANAAKLRVLEKL